jgi:peptidoglycan L-alanyl-D-glutamate endopeptidase CwlK
VDFGVICGLRSQEEQKALVAKGASQTMHSRHLTGNAVDLMTYTDDGRGCWELNVYDEIADAMKQAAMETGAKIRWGCAWHIDSLADYSGTMEAAMNLYIDLRRTAKRRPFLDGPHFELR